MILLTSGIFFVLLPYISAELESTISKENEVSVRHGGQNLTLAALQASATAMENLTSTQHGPNNMTIMTPSLAALSALQALLASTVLRQSNNSNVQGLLASASEFVANRTGRSYNGIFGDRHGKDYYSSNAGWGYKAYDYNSGSYGNHGGNSDYGLGISYDDSYGKGRGSYGGSSGSNYGGSSYGGSGNGGQNYGGSGYGSGYGGFYGQKSYGGDYGGGGYGGGSSYGGGGGGGGGYGGGGYGRPPPRPLPVPVPVDDGTDDALALILLLRLLEDRRDDDDRQQVFVQLAAPAPAPAANRGGLGGLARIGLGIAPLLLGGAGGLGGGLFGGLNVPR